MNSCYGQYCPMAHALDLVGERWALLIVRELMNGPLRYSDLAETLGHRHEHPRRPPARARGRRRDPEAAAAAPGRVQVYELTEYGAAQAGPARARPRGAHARSGRREEADLFSGWLENAVRIGLRRRRPTGASSSASATRSSRSRRARSRRGASTTRTVVIEGEPDGFFHFLRRRRPGGLDLLGRRGRGRAPAWPAAAPLRSPSERRGLSRRYDLNIRSISGQGRVFRIWSRVSQARRACPMPIST